VLKFDMLAHYGSQKAAESRISSYSRWRKTAISRPRIIRCRSDLVQSLITWHPIYYKHSSSKSQRSRSQR